MLEEGVFAARVIMFLNPLAPSMQDCLHHHSPLQPSGSAILEVLWVPLSLEIMLWVLLLPTQRASCFFISLRSLFCHQSAETASPL